ncbi:MAG: trypsin-like peptidase domain-containing protein [Roseburia sp.]|nr:trypsin-like peptidase domain-containing protein [Roseburia sp.]
MSVYSYGPQGPDGQGYHSQGNRRADEPFAAPGGSGPVIDMVPARQRKRHPFLYGLVLVALCGAAAYFGTVYANSRTMPEQQNVVVYQAPSGNAPVTGGARLDAASVAAAASDSVVEITTESVQTGSYFNQYVATGAGSGVIISADGYIVTNDHVISGANSIAVRLHDGTTLDAALVATDAKTDLAVIRVQAQGLIPATLGTSADLVVGQPVVAIGNPLGRLGGTVTDGIISAGGLFDAQARLVGVVNSKSSGSDVEGLGFAIPIDTARPVIEQLITQGYVSGRPSLGMELVELTSYRSAIFAGTGRLGVYVNNGGKTGLTNGDYLLSIDGLAIETMTDVKTALSGHSPGDTVTVQYLHSGAVREAAVVLVEDIPAA